MRTFKAGLLSTSVARPYDHRLTPDRPENLWRFCPTCDRVLKTVQDKVKHGEPLSASHKKMRPNDIHLTIAVTNYDGEVDMCDSATLGSWLGDDYTAEGSPVIKKYGINKVKCLTINTLISKYPQFANPDFLSLDVETNEAKVLECCDFEKFTPTLMIIENEVRGIDLRANWIHFIDPYYDLVETIPGNLVFLRKK